MSSIVSRMAELLVAAPNPDRDYFAVTLLAGRDGTLEYECFGGWIGFTDDKPPHEIREASIVNADCIVATWRDAGQTALVVDSADDFYLFFEFGGNAVIEKAIAKEVIPEWLAPHTVANVGQYGFVDVNALPAVALRRAPTPKLRMEILQRDNYRCRVCGRSPNNHTDLELHVHHIRPWAAGGVTEPANLITLCHTCHNGLDPHFEFSLFRLLPKGVDRTAEYIARLERYQTEVAERRREADE